MLTPDTFLLTLYVLVDDFCKAHLREECRPGPTPSLSRSEVVARAVFSRGASSSASGRFTAGQCHLRGAFPYLPARTQYNRLVRRHEGAITGFFLHLVEQLEAQHALYEALDGTAVVIRNAKCRGERWLAG